MVTRVTGVDSRNSPPRASMACFMPLSSVADPPSR